MKNNIKDRRLRRLCAVVIGAVFVLSGLFKLLDPVGAGLVMEEYFKFLHLGFLMPAAKVLGTALALFETLLGAALASGILRKLAAWASFLILGVFTLLTLALVIVNPDMDCGCFGEVIHLSNSMTFIKNLVLLLLALIAFLPMRDIGAPKTRKYVSFGIAAIAAIAFMFYSWNSIPLVDHTAFTPGSELLASLGENEGPERYSAKLIYEKNGQEGVFDMDKLPDSTWNFLRSEVVEINHGELVSQGTPNLSFCDSLGNVCDSKAAEGNVFAVSVYSVSKIGGGSWTKIAEALDGASEAGFAPLLLVNSTPAAMDTLSTMIPDVKERLLPNIHYADRKDLMSLNRSNGGATWFYDGQLIRKFHLRDLPDNSTLLKMTGDNPTEEMLRSGTKGRLNFQSLTFSIFAVLLLI